MCQADAKHGGRNPGLSSRSPHVLAWKVPLVCGTLQLTPPVFGRRKVLVGSWPGDGKLYALRPGDGSVIWSFTAPAGNGFQGAAAAVGDRVFAVTFGPTPSCTPSTRPAARSSGRRRSPVGAAPRSPS